MIEILPDYWVNPGLIMGWRYTDLYDDVSQRGTVVRALVTVYANGVPDMAHRFSSRREAQEWMNTVIAQLEVVDAAE